jgi:hypothetical protein
MQYYAPEGACAPDVGFPSPLIVTESAPIHVGAPDVGAMQGIMPFAALRRGNECCSEYIFSGWEKIQRKKFNPSDPSAQIEWIRQPNMWTH